MTARNGLSPQETIGTLNLKIAQLRHYMRILQQQQALSLPYPDHRSKLEREKLQVERELQRLLQSRVNMMLQKSN